MESFILYTTAILMALVGGFCAVLCLAWSIPSWRHRLARSSVSIRIESKELNGWPARVGMALISIGIAACAAASWYGCYCVLDALCVGI